MIHTAEKALAEMERHRGDFHRAYSKMEAAQKHIGEMMSLNVGRDIDYSSDLDVIAKAVEDMKFYSESFYTAKSTALRLITSDVLPVFKESEL